MSQANYALRLQSSLKTEAEQVAKREGTTLNQFINVAVAEKLSSLRTKEYFQKRAKMGNIKTALKMLDGLGNGDFLREGDEL